MGESIFAGTNDGVYRSTDEGKTWSATNAGIGYQVEGITRLGPYLFAATTGEGIFRSSDCGISWSEADSGLVSTMISDSVKVIDISSIVTVEKYLFAGPAKGGCYVSVDSGKFWTGDTGFTYYPVNNLFANDTYLFVGSNSGIFVSLDTGTTWKNISTDLEAPFAFAVSYSNVLVGTGNGIWLYSLSQLTKVKENVVKTPSDYRLNQNYPNPFNPSTTISFALPFRSLVSLKIFDMLGREVATIISQEMSAGNYSKQWNATNVSSGIYYYRLQAGTYIETKKLVLLK